MRIKNIADLNDSGMSRFAKAQVLAELKKPPPKAKAQPAPPSAIEVERSPQLKIYDALNERVAGIALLEHEGLVPGRKFRADIYLPASRLVIEMDGFQFHRSKEKFQKDRDRRNLMIKLGYPVLAYYYKRVIADIDGVIDEIMEAHSYYGSLASMRK